MACGTPALVYDSTACRELINEKVGKVIKVKDLNSAIDFISKVKSLGKDFFLKHVEIIFYNTIPRKRP